MELLEGESIIWHGHPTWRSTLSYILKGTFGSAVFLGLGILIDVLGGDRRWLVYGAIVFAAGVVVTIASGWILRRFTQYTISTQRLHIRKGILSKTETSTSLDRVQNVTITQSLLDRILRTGTVDFDTASDDPADTYRFQGIDDPQAMRERVARAQADAHREPGGLG